MTPVFIWPESHLFARASEQVDIVKRTENAVAAWLETQEIDAEVNALLPTFYVPFAAWVRHLRQQQSAPLVLGLCGGQGSGKSTVAALLSHVLEAGLGLRAIAISIDDFYKTYEERQEMARTVHPLFAIRGVPGTHDIVLAEQTLSRLVHLEAREKLSLVQFDKGQDTRAAPAQWAMCEGPLDVIILEGWCVGARAQANELLNLPVNALEATEDTHGLWRRGVNRILAQEYPRLFNKIDTLVLLHVGAMERVFAWRQLQEKKLRERIKGQQGEKSRPSRVMSEAQVERFVMHYERLTRHILAEMPQRADAVFSISAEHNPAEVRFLDV